jgi:hypothetical protein
MDYVNAVETLIENIKLRERKAKRQKCPEKYQIDSIMETWNQLFIGLKKAFFFVVMSNSPLETN